MELPQASDTLAWEKETGMTAVAFDTLKLARKLRDTAEMSQAQAEGVADALAEAMSGAELATKSDIRELEWKMDARFKSADARIDALEGRTNARFDALEGRIDALADRTDTRFDALERRTDIRFSAVDSRFETVLERIDRRFAESDARMVRYVVGVGITTIVTVLGAAWAALRFAPTLLHG